jgi:Holliday junction resolvasome RuvABC ATP-dependent DNA helicase subunit
LEEYTCDDIAKIILKQGVKITDDALPKVSSVCRGNARSAVEISQEIARYQHAHPGVLTSKGWNLLCGIIGYLPLGLSNIELTLLKVLKDRPDGTSLTRIGACLGMTREAVQKDLELFPAKLGLIEITTGGRVLTPKGQQYLKELGV